MEMEKVTFQNSKGLKLVGILHLPKEKVKSGIIVSHSFAATKDRPHLVKLSETLLKEGFTVLRFDFGGCGESENREITVKDQVDDLKSAISYLRKRDYREIGLLGESLGGLISILAYDSQIKAMVLWAPVTKAKASSIVQEEELKEKLNKESYIIYKKDGREFKISKEYLIERQSVNQQEILSRVKCPVLIIHGNKDDVIPLEHSKEAIQYLSEESKLEIIEEGDHKLDKKIDVVIPLSVNWFKKYLLK
jgi:alpha-beta hydrolase superfamily lysophospholipase